MASIARKFQVAVFRLPWTIGSEELRQHFSQFGTVLRSNVLFDKQSGFSRGYGFIHFATEDEQRKALEADHRIEGQTVLVNEARGKEQRPGSRRVRTRNEQTNMKRQRNMAMSAEVIIGDL